MRAIYLIARREYLSYVATWGFWLSLASLPVFIAIGAAIPSLVAGSQPVRYFAVIDETGRGLDQLITENRAAAERERVSDTLQATVRALQGEDAANAAVEIFNQDPDGYSQLGPALASVGLESAQGSIEPSREAIQIDPPARDEATLREYLTGARTITTPQGERTLFAVFIIQDSDEHPLDLTYLSANITASELREQVSRLLRTHLREQAFMDRGIVAEDVDAILDLRPNIINLDARPEAGIGQEVTRAAQVPFFVAVILAFGLWLAVFSVANMLLTSMIEEKGGKIIEVLLSTARFHEILIGKLLGIASFSFTLIAILSVIGTIAASIVGAALASMNPEIADILASAFDLGLFLAALFFFSVGYLMYGSIFLAMGALCDTLQDAQTLMGPVIWTLMLPMLLLAVSIQAPDSLVVKVASWVPLWTPFIMMARLPSDPPLWELLGASAFMIATMVFVLWASAAVFRQGALRQADADSVRRWFKFGKKRGA